ncbi:MAG: hypothetical protein HZB50_16690 [Chloroflexi bacterium]|nr:hypothetical protein [Chloroflexota bacterium]
MNSVRQFILITVLFLSGCAQAREEPKTPFPFSTEIFTATPWMPRPPIFGIYSELESCEFPCYWGIIPGVTKWRDVATYFSSPHAIDGPYGAGQNNYHIKISNSPETTYPRGMGISLRVENGIVSSITTYSNWVYENFDYSLSGVLSELGKPDEIWTLAAANSSDDQPYYTMILFYPSQGVMYKWEGNASKSGDLLKICPQDTSSRSKYAPEITLWHPSNNTSFTEFEEYVVGQASHFRFKYFAKLESITSDFTVTDFYQTYSDPSTTSCIGVKPAQ